MCNSSFFSSVLIPTILLVTPNACDNYCFNYSFSAISQKTTFLKPLSNGNPTFQPLPNQNPFLSDLSIAPARIMEKKTIPRMHTCFQGQDNK